MLFHVSEVPRIGGFTETECGIVVARDLGSYCLVGTEFLFEMKKNVWKWTVVLVARHLHVLITPPYCTIKNG